MAWRVLGASAPGALHQRVNMSCQDAFYYKVLSKDLVVVAIADGAGFAAHPAEGAKMAVKQAVVLLADHVRRTPPNTEADWKETVIRAFDETRRALVKAAASAGEAPDALATTLTCALAFDTGLAVGQIGDGVVVAETVSGSLFLAAKPYRGEYANQSVFITMPQAMRFLKVKIYNKPVRALALITDGLLRLAVKLPQCRPHPQFFRPLLTFALETDSSREGEEQLTEFLTSPRVCDRTEDDKTIVLAVRTVPPTDRRRPASAGRSLSSLKSW